MFTSTFSSEKLYFILLHPVVLLHYCQMVIINEYIHIFFLKFRWLVWKSCEMLERLGCERWLRITPFSARWWKEMAEAEEGMCELLEADHAWPQVRFMFSLQVVKKKSFIMRFTLCAPNEPTYYRNFSLILKQHVAVCVTVMPICTINGNLVTMGTFTLL